MSSTSEGGGLPPLWTEAVVILVQPRKVAAGTDGRFFDPGERLLGSLQGTQYGRKDGIEVRDAEGRLLLTVQRAGWNKPHCDLLAGDGSEWGQVVTKAHLTRRPEWEISTRGAGGWELVARAQPRRAGRTLITTIADRSGNALAAVEGTVSRPQFRIVDTSSAYQLTRTHAGDAYWGALEIGALVAMDVTLRAAAASASTIRL